MTEFVTLHNNIDKLVVFDSYIVHPSTLMLEVMFFFLYSVRKTILVTLLVRLESSYTLLMLPLIGLSSKTNKTKRNVRLSYTREIVR